ncbi:MAG: SPFH domain-containing protein, partial [Nannocystaceae bacterium]
MNKLEKILQNEAGADRREQTRITNGWRRGKPVEDPEKTKPWGFVTAKPSEYLIHVRRGQVRRRSTGQGASCFKWPWDSVAIIPTTINRLQFAADQVTREKVGVEVTGLAVYRIVEPELAFRMLNFSFAERASEKLAAILREMFIGATRRLVANLTVEDVFTRRKEAIGSELMSELAPIMEGVGRDEDTTSCGWGVVLDTVEIQNIRILSEAVFRDMQAKFRAELAMRAREAELDSTQEIATREAASARQVEEAKLSSEAATRQLRAEAESRSTEIEVREASRREALASQAREAKFARIQAEKLAELRFQATLAQEKAQQQEKARIETLARDQRILQANREVLEARHQQSKREVELEAELELLRLQAELQRKETGSAATMIREQRDLELTRLTGEVTNHLELARKQTENLISEGTIRMAMVEKALPAIATSFAQKFGEVKFTHFGGDASQADPTTMITRSLMQVFEIAKGVGVDL